MIRHTFLGGRYDGYLCSQPLYVRLILIDLVTQMCLKFAHVQLTVTIHRLTGSLFSLYQTKYDAKMTKMKQNYMAKIIMNVSGTHCQLIHYFPGNQGLAINLTWAALKSKQHTCV